MSLLDELDRPSVVDKRLRRTFRLLLKSAEELKRESVALHLENQRMRYEINDAYAHDRYSTANQFLRLDRLIVAQANTLN